MIEELLSAMMIMQLPPKAYMYVAMLDEGNR
jgi:hypothetical protein